MPNIYLSRDIESVSELYGQRLYIDSDKPIFEALLEVATHTLQSCVKQNHFLNSLSTSALTLDKQRACHEVLKYTLTMYDLKISHDKEILTQFVITRCRNSACGIGRANLLSPLDILTFFIWDLFFTENFDDFTIFYSI
jgi:hypothetical protein